MAAQPVDHFNEAGVDFLYQHLFDDADGRLVGDAQPLDELAFEARFSHGRGDGLAPAVHDDNPDPGVFEEDRVLEDARNDGFVLHGAAAQLDDEGAVTESLEVGQGLEQDMGLFDDVFHRIPSASSKPNMRFRFCTACPACPLSRLSMAEKTRQSVPSQYRPMSQKLVC